MLFSKQIYQKYEGDGVGTQKYPTHNLKMCFEPLYYSMLQLWMNTYKRDEKLSNDTIFTQKLNYSIMYTFILKAGDLFEEYQQKNG